MWPTGRVSLFVKIITPEESKRLNAVESGFGDAESIARAIGNATKVVVTVGRGEDGPSAGVTTDDAFRVVQAAQLAGVGHVVVIYDSAAGSPEPSTNNVLDGLTSFFNNIFSPAKPSLTVGQFLEKVAKETEVSYTLVKASLADDYTAEQVEPRGLVVAGEGAGTAAGAGTAGDYKVRNESNEGEFIPGGLPRLPCTVRRNSFLPFPGVSDAGLSSSSAGPQVADRVSRR